MVGQSPSVEPPTTPPLALALAVFAFALAFGPWAVARAAGVPPPTGTWQLDPAPAAHAIEGYASELSVAPGDVLRLHTSTNPAARYRVEIYRIGWYDGAGGKLIACAPGCDVDEQGSPQAIPSPDPSTGVLAAPWPITDRVSVGADWPSGLYLAKLVLTSGDETGKSARARRTDRPWRLASRAPGSRRMHGCSASSATPSTR